MKHTLIRKLNNVSEQMIERLFIRAQELGLSKKDLFVHTSLEMIKSRLRSYTLGLKFGESLSIKSFVKDSQRIIDSLTIAHEEVFFI